jgi:two-component system response regulator FimZ (fimbrial Z protein)/two-component system response regulator EvgA
MRIILADHHTQPCWALKTLLSEQPEFEIIGEAVDADGLLSLAEKHLPDLVLVDGELPGLFIEDLITRLHVLEPPPIVVVMSSEFENSRKLLKAGADAFVSKGDEPAWLLETLQKFESRSKKNE